MGQSNAAFIVADIRCSNIWLLEDCSWIGINLWFRLWRIKCLTDGELAGALLKTFEHFDAGAVADWRFTSLVLWWFRHFVALMLRESQRTSRFCKGGVIEEIHAG